VGQGNGQVWLGTANAVVTSWSDTQIVATVAVGPMIWSPFAKDIMTPLLRR